MAESPGRSLTAGGLFPIDIEQNWSKESEMLRHKLTLLDDFKKSERIVNSVWSTAEECRYLEYQIQCLAGSIGKKEKSREADKFIQDRMDNDMPRKPIGFDLWWQDHEDFKLKLHGQRDLKSEGLLGGTYRCFDSECKHYVYGFGSADILHLHIDEHRRSQLAPSSSIFDPNHSNLSMAERDVRADRMEDNQNLSPPEVDVESRTTIQSSSYPVKRSRTEASGFHPLPPKKKRGMSGDFSNSEICLRCKILKKGCGSQHPCAECPTQDVNSTDYWKALGCFQGTIADLSQRCLPSNTSALQSTYQEEDNTRDEDFDDYYKGTNILTQDEAFRQLQDACWEDAAIRKSLLDQLVDTKTWSCGSPLLSGDYRAAVGLIRIGSYDSVYLEKTAYNPFTLLRISDSLAAQFADEKAREILPKAKNLVTIAMVSYGREKRVLEYMRSSSNDRFNSSDGLKGSPIRLSNLREHLVDFLKSFDQFFSHRTILTAEGWLGTFYALCFFSIAKSIMIDTFFMRNNDEATSLWNISDAVQISAVYKVLVSAFVWSSRISGWCPNILKARDPMLVDWTANDGQVSDTVSTSMRKAFKETQEMIGRSSWAGGSIKPSKDFLMSLGSGELDDGVYNGFLVQRYGRTLRPAGDTKGKAIDSCSPVSVAIKSQPEEGQVEEKPSAMNLDPPNTALASNSGEFLTSNGMESDISGFKQFSGSSSFPKFSRSLPSPRVIGREQGRVRIEDLLHDDTINQMGDEKYRQQEVVFRHPLSPSASKAQRENDDSSFQAHHENQTKHRSSLVDSSDPTALSEDIPRTVHSPVRESGQSALQHAKIYKFPEPLDPGGRRVDDGGLIQDFGGRLPSKRSDVKYSDIGSPETPGSVLLENPPITDRSCGNAGFLATTDSDLSKVTGESVMRMDVDSGPLHSSISTWPRPMQTMTFRLNDGPALSRSSRGPKTQEKRERAAKIRRIGACQSCRAKKVQCDTSHPRDERPGSPNTGLGIRILTSDGEDMLADIVFVHGLDGDQIMTWTNDGGVFWPKEFLAKDLSNVRLLTYGYKSSKFDLPKPVVAQAENLLQELHSWRENIANRQRPVFFIGHSYGGLIIKEALLKAAKSILEQEMTIWKSVAGLIFMGTPHSALHTVTPPKNKYDGPQATSPLVSSSLFTALQKGSMISDSHREEFVSASKSMQIVCFYETKLTDGQLIVPESNAVLEGQGVEKMGLETDHAGLCKFSDTNQGGGYFKVLQVIKTRI